MTELSTPFHAGERYVQQRAGAQREALLNGRIIAAEITPAVHAFVAAQQLTVLGTLDALGRPWASVVFGPAGFVRVLDAHHAALDVTELRADAADACWANTAVGARVGLLLLELRTRRRFRLNGAVAARSAAQLVVEVHQAFPNCPKYIQRRSARALPAVAATEPVAFTTFGAAHQGLLRQADTFFVASANAARDVDASHRGGRPAFVQVLDATTLLVPDYPGNGMFNTLGNFVSYPRAGLLFVDFASGRMLQMTGTVALAWDQPGTEDETGGTARFWRFSLEAGQELRGLHGGAWSEPEYSPFNP